MVRISVKNKTFDHEGLGHERGLRVLNHLPAVFLLLLKDEEMGIPSLRRITYSK